MGCRCCRMIKSYIYDPTVAVDVRKADSAGNSLYQPHHYPSAVPNSGPLSDHPKQKEGFQNLGYSKSNDSTLKLEADNNQVNRKLHSVPVKESHRQAGAPSGEAALYIIQPDDVGPRWGVNDKGPSQVPIYPNIEEYTSNHGSQSHTGEQTGWAGSITKSKVPTKTLSVDEIDEGVGGTPEYPCDTGDEASVLSVDIHTSTTSLSSADTKDGIALPKTPDVSTLESGISVAKSEEDETELQSITDSMVAEALAELEAATAGEESE